MNHRKSRLRQLASVTGLVLWATLILGLYYWVHKPLTPALADALAGAAIDIAVSLLFVLVSAGIGRRFLRTLGMVWGGQAEQLAAASITGLGLLSLALLIAGSVVLNRASVALVLLAGFVIGAGDVWTWASDCVRGLRGGIIPRERWGRFLVVTASVMMGMAFILALLPPTKWDVLTYHLAGPEQYVARGRFYAAEHNHFLGFPQLVEVLFASQLALTGRLAGGGLLHWFVGLFLLVSVWGTTARHRGATAGWLAVNILLTAFTVWLEMTMAYVDLMPMALAVLGVSSAGHWRANQRPGPRPDDDLPRQNAPAHPANPHPLQAAALLGVLAGLGLGTKYSVLWLVFALAGIIVLNRRAAGWKAAAAALAVFAGAALVVFSPWLIRNTLWYHNPVYPLVFEAAEMDSVRLDWYSQPRSGLIYGANAWQLPVLPVVATILGVEGAGTFGTDIGPLFLLLCPLVLFVWKILTPDEQHLMRQALVVSGIITLAWVISAAFGSYISLQTRLVLYLFGPLAIVAALTLVALRQLPRQLVDLGFVMQAMVALTIVFAVVSGLRYWAEYGIQQYFSGDADYREAFLRHALGWHYETMRKLDSLPAQSTVRFLWEPRYLYCDDTRLVCRPDSLMDGWYHARRAVEDGSAEAIAYAWRDGEDINYLLVYEFGREFERDSARLYDTADWDAWELFVDGYLEEVWRTGNADDDIQYILYRWQLQGGGGDTR